jgi:hypothetical protein
MFIPQSNPSEHKADWLNEGVSSQHGRNMIVLGPFDRGMKVSPIFLCDGLVDRKFSSTFARGRSKSIPHFISSTGHFVSIEANSATTTRFSFTNCFLTRMKRGLIKKKGV